MSRSCFPCTACCQGWLAADINGFEMFPGQPCKHCSASGCLIYENRPENPCKIFKCAWLKEESKIPESLKPSKCGAILMLDRDWNGRKVIRAVPAGATIPQETFEQLKKLVLDLKMPLLFGERVVENNQFVGHKSLGYGPPSFIEAVKNEILPQDVMRFDKPES